MLRTRLSPPLLSGGNSCKGEAPLNNAREQGIPVMLYHVLIFFGVGQFKKRGARSRRDAAHVEKRLMRAGRA